MPLLRFEQSLLCKIVPEEGSCHVLPSRRDGALWRRELVKEGLVQIYATMYSTVTERAIQWLR
jgi:hypothetical protein